MSRTWVLGVGNILLQDEGVGVRVVERLQQAYNFPEEVQVLDGGSIGLDLLPFLLGVDAGDNRAAERRRNPPLLGRKLSPHQIGLADLLSVAGLETGLELSPAIKALLPLIVGMVLEELKRWGHMAEPQ